MQQHNLHTAAAGRFAFDVGCVIQQCSEVLVAQLAAFITQHCTCQQCVRLQQSPAPSLCHPPKVRAISCPAAVSAGVGVLPMCRCWRLYLAATRRVVR
jgi:hypothetical protein